MVSIGRLRSMNRQGDWRCQVASWLIYRIRASDICSNTAVKRAIGLIDVAKVYMYVKRWYRAVSKILMLNFKSWDMEVAGLPA